MNNSFLFFLVFILLSLNSYSQDTILVSPFITVDGEKIITSNIPQLDIIDFIDNAERRSFYKFNRSVLKVYPSALQTQFKVDSLNIALSLIGKKRKKLKHTRSTATIIKQQYAIKRLNEKTAYMSITVGLIASFLLFPIPDFSKSLLVGIILPIELFPPFVSQSLLFLSFLVATFIPISIWKLR